MAGSSSRLGKALEEAALQNLNEDIHEILTVIEKISVDVPANVRHQLEPVRQEVDAIAFALKNLPQQFDDNFSKKITRVLNLLEEIENISEKQKENFQKSFEEALSNTVNRVNRELSSIIKNSFIIKRSSLFFLVFFTALCGGITGAAAIASIVYYTL